MNENELPASAPDREAAAAPGAPLSEAFYDRAVWRMQRTIGVIGIAIIVVSALGFGLAVTLGATLGVALSWHNFRWLT